jgi:hypothetical protein
VLLSKLWTPVTWKENNRRSRWQLTTFTSHGKEELETLDMFRNKEAEGGTEEE